ncbi:hypothetical protein DSM112329_00031 [Paraconexibacter sp. AEG42_29]|uniref:Flagellar hook-length control protein FliK n=1 Tax=Paraconexibacter sp. AEG42_29 TaxID=2997339 RepID=A0AAU7ANP4_9ACTN
MVDHGGVTVPLPTIAVDLAILRSAIGDTALRPGLMLFGRVTERSGDHGLMLLNGAPVVARLPDAIHAGARLRLQVVETRPEGVLLQVVEDADAPAPPSGPPSAATAPVVAFPLPGGAQVQVHAELAGSQDGGAGGGGRSGRGGAGAVWLRLDTPQLGRLDVRVDALSCAVACSDGVPAQAARAALPELRAALAAATGRPLLVTLHPRRQALDVSA